MSPGAKSPLDGKVALVTGGTRGIGRAIAFTLGGAGARVAVASRTEAANEAAAAELREAGTPSLGVTCDVINAESVSRAVQAVQARFKRVDILVNNAGAAESEPILRTTREIWDRMLAVNLTGTFLCSRTVLEGMVQRKRGGRIINIASTAGLVGHPYVSAYCAAKHGVVGLTRALAREVAREGITVNAVCPGYVDTEMTARSIENIVARTGMSEAEAREALEKMSPQRRLFQPQEVADLVLMLAGDGAAGINGQAIVLDGGAVGG